MQRLLARLGDVPSHPAKPSPGLPLISFADPELFAPAHETTVWSGRLQASATAFTWNGLGLSPLAALQGRAWWVCPPLPFGPRERPPIATARLSLPALAPASANTSGLVSPTLTASAGRLRSGSASEAMFVVLKKRVLNLDARLLCCDGWTHLRERCEFTVWG